MAALEISPIKIGYVIVKAREVAAKVASWDDGATSDRDADSILESFSDDATRAELKSFIQDMNEDEQASLVALAMDAAGIPRLHAIVGASYGGMIALAFARLFPERVERLVVISAAHRPHPMATAWRGIQRRILQFAVDSGRPEDGVALARQLAMTTYRTPAGVTSLDGRAPSSVGFEDKLGVRIRASWIALSTPTNAGVRSDSPIATSHCPPVRGTVSSRRWNMVSSTAAQVRPQPAMSHPKYGKTGADQGAWRSRRMTTPRFTALSATRPSLI